ncbi:glutaredoxin-C9-like [Syzygium oleosum]|uniref:glutaredoxin-C9-like n=1 Tax=Syzygium oleosum TaxID=219896 RepID=UPI0024B9EE77|nr:glutaredoxin-C9-like [Syzygium oleosum]
MQLMPKEAAAAAAAAAGIPASDGGMRSSPGSSYEAVRRLAAGSAVVLFSTSGCCMCTVAKSLLFGLGAGPTVVELDELDGSGRDIHAVLYQLAAAAAPGGGDRRALPAVFVGGKFLGGLEALMACHINGTLVPLLKDAGALWL